MTLDDAVPPVLRQISVRSVMDVLLNHGATSRTELARITGLSKQTMSEVIRALEGSGWVQAKGVTSGRVGRSAIIYEVTPDAGFVVGVDLGATTIRLAVANMVGDILKVIEAAADSRGGLHLFIQLGQLKDELLSLCRLDPGKILLAAVATPGVVDPEVGTLSLAPNFADMDDFDIPAVLRKQMECDIVIENDVNAAVIGESWRGCAVGIDEVAFVSLGTGIGLGALVNGKLLRGATGAAGEISYLPFGADPCSAESLERGALESAIGARSIRERYQGLGGQAGLTVRDILSRAEAGDETALQTMRETARIAALMVVSVSALLDPKKIVLGGNIGRNPAMVKLIGAQLPLHSRRPIAVEASALGQAATLHGSVAIALNQAHNLLFSPQDLPQPLRLPQARR
ncbi:Transcriptional regulator ROK family [uncultured Pleomorphomonas sp.]|uniref:Transcriptional regulator n=2 Tax=Pleomorphomonas TaxID=261933 RepID=A0A2G9X1N7_9HYPH|nr:ROK family transcriptional regulator [Pleomorphomonas carboxyditropha]PIP00878.1 transcriptional regulator [Pleomorphomonas carboxyditropha]SCM72975.1 Transcriptional regulator ROK family [uncultured Pleomorphomonas sp.]